MQFKSLEVDVCALLADGPIGVKVTVLFVRAWVLCVVASPRRLHSRETGWNYDFLFMSAI